MEPLENGCFYHVFNRGNNKQQVFFEDGNYLHFVKLVKKHLLPVVDIYSYCLLKNHFHLLVRIKEAAVNPSQKFSNLFNAYTKAINKRYNRTGSLFEKSFHRKKISDEKYLKSAIIYIHLNPVFRDFRDYPFPSYQSFLKSGYTFLSRNEVLSLFDDQENFKFVHENHSDSR